MSQPSLTVCDFPGSVGRREAVGEMGCERSQALLAPARLSLMFPGLVTWRGVPAGAEVMLNVTALALGGL